MKDTAAERPLVEIAYGAMVTDGFFALAYALDLLGRGEPPALSDFLWIGVIICVFLSACWVIYDDYWKGTGGLGRDVVKRLRIREMGEGATIEYDGKWYRVENIDRRSGEILIERIGHPGRIIVHIEGQQ
ncbi:hypothetical protein LPW11_12185 [Geomonas sp. RF6]|uniref:hypothetical protein n=1 Tax=Geomonas sp. RF6 TaxID=2897342 RepID=UPI001E655DD7|nr:hypothetical protein [Geomonas sp. RF6]UFS68668.1 hypothetical protein LPW11_12185 [Geomonas sp. RF6]